MSIRSFAKLFVYFVLASSASADPGPASGLSTAANPIVEPSPICDSKWYITVGGGLDVDLGTTNATQGFDAETLTFAPSGNGMLDLIDVEARFHSHKWSDAFGNSWNVDTEAGRVLGPHLEIFGLFKYASAAGNSVGDDHLLLMNRTSLATTDISVITEFGNYNSVGGELGFRAFFLPNNSRFRPYVALSGGTAHVNDIGIIMRGSSGEIIYHGGFFNGTWVGTGTAKLGIKVDLDCRWSIGVEGGFRYESSVESDDAAFHPGFFRVDGPQPFEVGLKSITSFNQSPGDRCYWPVNGYVKFRF